jgi:hypothetical protein
MFKEPEFFLNMKPFEGNVILGDGCTKLPIQGIGTVGITIDNHPIIIHDVRFVPTLSESVYSLLQHIKQTNHGLQSSFETGLHISFPGFSTAAIIGQNDIYLNAKPSNTFTSDHSSKSSSIPDIDNFTDVCHHINQDTSDVTSDSKDMNNLLKSLRRYYDSVRTKRQLNLNVPAGFHQTSQVQQLFHNFMPPKKAPDITQDTSLLPVQLLSDITNPTEVSQPSDHVASDPSPDDKSVEYFHPVTDAFSNVPVPILRCVDKMSLPLPSRLTVTEDFICASVGFAASTLSKNIFQPFIKILFPLILCLLMLLWI